MKRWHTKKISEIFQELGTKDGGLAASEAARRLSLYGPNTLPEQRREGLGTIFLRQFESPLIYVLLAASVAVFFIGESVDAAVILFVLLFNAIVGTIQEGRAQHTLTALKRFVETNATVLRDGKEESIPDKEVVLGDIIVLHEGERIPADARVIWTHLLKVDEAALTGESEAVEKISEPVADAAQDLIRQRNMVFKGTHIVAGNARAVVVATGTKTVIGKISQKIAIIDTEIPLKADIRVLSAFIIYAALLIGIFLFMAGLGVGKSVKEMFLTVISLSVSIIPEGLPIVLTLVLATGVWRMSKRNALVKRLQAVEALGQASIIAVDKTGTLTRNEMLLEKVFAGGKFFTVEGSGYDPKGSIFLETKSSQKKLDNPSHSKELALAARVAALCAKARTFYSTERQLWSVAGDPTEAAMFVFAQKAGFSKDTLEEGKFPLQDIPFDYTTKYHGTVHRVGKKNLLTIVGAPESVLKLSRYVWVEGKKKLLSEGAKKELEEVWRQMSTKGLRVLAFAFHDNVAESIKKEDIRGLTAGGFLGLRDAIRKEVKLSITEALQSGIRVVMITGDHADTAKSVAKAVGIFKDGDEVMTGEMLDSLSDAELAKRFKKVSVFARVTPDHKLRIITVYRQQGETIAMTGDGVNDAPSLVAADLGVGMGKIGTEVAKEASDIVLLDDNIASIIAAIQEGRNIYKTIKKVLLYLFSTSVGEVLTIAGALFLLYPLPISPVQILWLNLVTDGFLDVALAMEPKEKGLLSGRFKRSRYLVDSLMLWRMLIMALPMMIGTLYLFSFYKDGDITKAWSISLVTLAVFQWFNAWNCRSEGRSIFQMNPFSNRYLLAATGIVILLQLSALYLPVMQGILRTTPLTLHEWLIIVPIASSIIIVEEIRKCIYRAFSRENAN